MNKENNDLKQKFNEIFNSDYENIYISPARINLIGEHLDYNKGHVLPCAIDLYMKAYVSKRNDNKIYLYSENTKKLIITDLNHLDYDDKFDWAKYPIGLIYILNKNGYTLNKGINIYFTSDIPLGCGLSSSASILVLTAYLLNKEYNFNLSNKQIIDYSVSTEQLYIKVSSGIMDETIICLGKKANALLIDCKTKNIDDYKNISYDLGEYSLVVLNTNKHRALQESKYNERVEECYLALRTLENRYEVDSLCDFDSSNLLKIEKILKEADIDENVFKRVRHVITEEERVKDFIKAINNHDTLRMGEILNESHYSLRDDYEVSGFHLDLITDLARKNGSIGSRMTGAGFGGCAIALVKTSDFDNFKDKVSKEYYKQTQIMPDIFIVHSADGAIKEK